VLAFSDLSAYFFSFFFSHFIMGYWAKDFDYPLFELLYFEREKYRAICYVILSFFGILIAWYHFYHYTNRKPFWIELKEIIHLISVLAVFDLATMALSKWDFSRFSWFLVWLLCMFFIPIFRSISKVVLTKIGIWLWPAVIVGAGGNSADAYHALSGEKSMGIDIIGFIPVADDDFKQSPVENIPLISEEINSYIHFLRPMLVFIALEYYQDESRDYWLRVLALQKCKNIIVIPTLRGIPLYCTDISHLFSHELLMLRLRNNLERFSAQVIKRLFDIIVSSLLLVVLSPLFLFLSFKVSCDGGVPFYSHERIGRRGKPFKCYKFRSMVKNSKHVLEILLASDPAAREEWEREYKLKNDPRISPIGKILRKTSLDELPQLWNVLIGDMSLVGPRPIVKDELIRYGDDVDYYLMTRPGMTGLWQVSGRNDVDYTMRVHLDGWYVKNWSLWYDIVLLCKTISVLITHNGAY